MAAQDVSGLGRNPSVDVDGFEPSLRGQRQVQLGGTGSIHARLPQPFETRRSIPPPITPKLKPKLF